MGKSQRPVRRSTNRTGLEEYLKSLEPQTNWNKKQEVDTTEQKPNSFDSFDPTDEKKVLPDSFFQKNTGDSFDTLFKPVEPAITESTSNQQQNPKINEIQNWNPREEKLFQYGETIRGLRDEIEKEIKNLDKTNKNQVDYVNSLITKLNEQQTRLKSEFPIFNLPQDVIDYNFKNGFVNNSNQTTISEATPENWTNKGFDDPFSKMGGLTDEQKASNYVNLMKSLNDNISISQAEKENSIWGTPGGRIAGSFIQGVASIPDGFYAFGEMMADQLGIPQLKQSLLPGSMQLRQVIEGVAPADPNFVEGLVSGTGSMIAFMVPGAVAANAGKLAGLTPKLAQWLGIGTSAMLESITESGNVYRESGDVDAATKTLLANLLLVSITNRFGIQAEEVGNLKNILMSVGTEGLQEGLQEIISNASQGKEIPWNNVLESAAIGSIIGAGTSFTEGGNGTTPTTPDTQTPVSSPLAGVNISPEKQVLNVDPNQVNPETGFTNFQFEDKTNDQKTTELSPQTTETSTKEVTPTQEVKGKTEEIKQEPVKPRDIPSDEAYNILEEITTKINETDDKYIRQSVKEIYEIMGDTEKARIQEAALKNKIKLGSKQDLIDIVTKDYNTFVSSKEKAKPFNFEPLTIEKVRSQFAESEYLADEQIKDYVDKNNSILQEIADWGFDPYNVPKNAPERIQNLREILVSQGTLIRLAKQQKAKNKGYKRFDQEKLDKTTKTFSDEINKSEPTDEEIISNLEDDNFAADIEDEVNQAATSPKNELPEPTEAQKEAGNYKKGHIKVAGLDISIENPKDSERSGIDPDGKKWSQKMQDHYGYFTNGTENKDGKLDVFVNPDIKGNELATAFIVDQVDPKTKDFDEMKVMLGYSDIQAAKDAYLRNYEKNWAGLGNITEVNDISDLKDLIQEGDITKPFNYEKPVPVKEIKFDNPKAVIDGTISTPAVISKAKQVLGENFQSEFDVFKTKNKPVQGKDKTFEEGRILEQFARNVVAADIMKMDYNADVIGAANKFGQKETEVKSSSIGIEIKKNTEKDGIEIYFNDKKPTSQQIDFMKSQGLRLFRGTNKWYAKYSTSREAALNDYFTKGEEKNGTKEGLLKTESGEKQIVSPDNNPPIAKEFNPIPTYEKILTAIDTTNDKSLPGKTRVNAKSEMAILSRKLLQNGITAQVKSSGGKWGFYIDGKKQNRRTLGLVETTAKVKAADVVIENENAKTPFSELPDDVVRKQTVASKLVTADDLPSGIGEAALKKGVEDIIEDSGKEQNPEAQIVRDAAENILKEGQGRVVQVKGQKRQDLSAEEINSFVDDQIQKENNPDKIPDYLRAARNKLADLENDVFATDAELTAAQKQLKAAENKFADENNKLIDVEPTKTKEPIKPKSKSKTELQFDKLLKEGSIKELQDYKRILNTNGAIAKEFADRKTEMIKKIDARINFIKDTKQDMFGAAEAEKQENIFDQDFDIKPKNDFVNIKVFRGEGNNTGQAWNGAGKYYTDNKAEASLYGTVSEHTITLKNPIRIDQINDSSVQGSGIVELFASIKELKDQKFNGKTFEEINKLIKLTEKEVNLMKLYYTDGTNKNFKHVIYEYDGKDKSLHNKTEEEIKDKNYIKGLITSRILNEKYNIKHLPIRISEAINPNVFSEIAQRQGFDGVVAENSTLPNGNEYVVFERSESKLKQKIKSIENDELKNALDDFLGTMGKLSAGIDPDQLAKGMKLIEVYAKLGTYKFADIVTDLYAKIGDEVKKIGNALKQAYGAFLADATDDIADKMDDLRTVRSLDIDKIINEVTDSKEEQNDVSDRPGSSQQNSGDAGTPLSDNEEIISGQRKGRGSNRVEDNESDTGKGIDTESSLGTPGSVTPSIGTSGNNQLSGTDKESRLTDTDAGNSDGRGSDWISGQGEELQFDEEGEAIIEEHNKDVSQNFKERTRLARIKQKQVENVSVKLLDRNNIDETLPYLLPAQRDDVELAEKRFFSKEQLTPEKTNGKGIMFTNGTGTGKTFSGLGIVKRFVKQGKNNILIVTPTQPKVNDWINEGKELLLNITALNDTIDQGRGVNVTTFANFRQNEALKNRDFDLIIYDESHRIMESKTGDTSSTTHAHYQHGNATEYAALSRLQDVHPLWIEHRALNKRFTELNRALNNDTSINPVADEKEVAELNKKIAVLDAKMAKVEPALKERAAQAYKNTKVVFLSATPFKAHFNLRYANRFLFDWGSEITYESASRGQSRVDPESRFYLDNFGAAYTWKYHQLQTRPKANPEAIAMQEIAFNEKLKSEGVLSARIIDSEFDYSRDFPVVAGFDNGVFNKAFNDIFNYSEDANFKNLRSAAADVFMDYNYTTQLFESMKAGLSVDRIQKHLDLDRKVVIFHRRQQGNASAPFMQILERANNDATATYNDPEATPESKEKAKETLRQVLAFGKKYSNLLDYEQTIDYRSAVAQIGEKFKGKIAFVNGNVSNKEKIKAIRDFNDDNGNIKIIMAQEDAGKEGISLHDTSERFQRVLMSLSMPISSTTALQIEGRVYRIGQASNAIFEYPLLGLDLEVAHFGQNINKKVSTTENLALGELSRDLLRSYSEGVLFNSTTAEPSKNQGVGGKDYDKKSQKAAQSEFQRARLVYDTNQKIRGSRDNRKGIDFYPTPEPLGQKMVEWANVKEDESVLEPSAGNGAIAMWVPKNITLTAVEPSFDLFSKLSARASGSNRKIIQSTFEDFNIINKVNAVVMNPPFGAAGTTALQHVQKAYHHLKNGGRIVALVPRGAFDTKFEKWQNDDNFPKDLYVRSKINLPSVTFEQAGTKVNAQIIILDKFANAEDAGITLYQSDLDFSNAETINEFFDNIENVSVADRSEIPNTINHQGKTDNATAPKEGELATVTSFNHTQTKAKIYVVKLNSRVTAEDYYAANDKAKKFGGRYSKFSKDGAIPGFLFKSEAAANEVANWINKIIGDSTINDKSVFNVKLYQALIKLDVIGGKEIKDLATATGKSEQSIKDIVADLKTKRLLVLNPMRDLDVTDEFKTLLADINENPEKYEDDYGYLYSNPLPVMLKGIGKIQKVVDDLWSNTVGMKVYKGLGKGILKLTPEKVKEAIITNYGLPAEYVTLKREALDAIERYKELAKQIADNLQYADVQRKIKFTEAEQMRLSQIIKGGVSTIPIMKQRAEMAIREIKELEKLGRDLETLPIETYNTKLPRARINELLTEKRGFEKDKQKILDKFGDPEDWDADDKKAAKRATAKLTEKIAALDKKIKDSYLHGNEGYLKRVYLSKEQEKRLSKYGITKPTRLDLTSAMHRKDIPFEIRKELGEILTAAYPAAKGIMLEGKDVSLGNLFKVVSENPDWSSETEIIGWKQLPKDRKLGKLSELWVEPHIYADINDVIKFTDTDNLESFMKQINATWKATKTIMNPSTHFRNIYSNSIMLDFSGVSQIDQARLLPSAIQAVKGNGRFAADFKASRLNNTTFNQAELNQYLDLVTANQGEGFLGMRGLSFPDKILKLYGTVTLVDTPVGELLGKVYQYEEVLGKAVKFIAERENGKTILEARNEANKWLFDYTDVPSLVRRLRTNPVFGVPFVTWSYKAFPRILEAAITRPISFWKYPVIFSALMKYALKALDLDDDDWEKIAADLPNRMLKGEWLLLPFKDENGKMQMLDLTYILPYKDVYDIIASGFTLATQGKFNNDDDIVDGLLGLFQAPILKTAAELIANKNTYSNTPIWMDVDNPREKAIKVFDYMYKTFMPSLAPEVPFISEGGYAYHKMRSVISGRDDYYGRTFGFVPAVASSFFGIKTSPIEMEKNVERKLYKLQEQLIQLATKRNNILRDDTISDDAKLSRSLEVDQKSDEVRLQIQELNIPVKNDKINSTESEIKKLQKQLSNIPLDRKNHRKEMNVRINTLKIKLNEMMASPEAYTGEYEEKDKQDRRENRRTLNKSMNKSLSKSLSR